VPRQENGPAAEGSSPNSRGRLAAWVREPVKAALLAVIGALAAAGAGLALGIFKSDPEPSGNVSIQQTLRNQTLRMFRGEATEPGPADAPGTILDVARSSEDTAPGECRLVWSYLDADGPTPVADPSLVSQPAKYVRPDPTSCTAQARIWVPLAAGLEGYENIAVRIDFYAGDHLLSSSTSKTIPLG
jgi:hypothetical protein